MLDKSDFEKEFMEIWQMRESVFDLNIEKFLEEFEVLRKQTRLALADFFSRIDILERDKKIDIHKKLKA